MRAKRKWIGCSLVVLLAGAIPVAGAIAQDAKVSGVDLRQCGVYTNEPGAVGDSRLVRETREIPAGIGTAFGCEVVLRGAPRGAMAEFVVVPRLPAGAARESYRGPQSFPVDEGGGYVGYTFRSEENLVAGPWNLEIWVNEKKLAETAFVVTK
jgi:hypothetical protein